MTPNHTFAIVAYKESAHLQECIDSLLNQTIKSDVIICTSTPSAFLDEIATRNNLQLLVNPNRIDVVEDWNFALQSVNGELITLAHQDDIYHKTYAQEIISEAQANDDALIIFSDYDEIVHGKNEIYTRKNSLNFFIKRSMLRFYFCCKKKITKNKERLLSFGNPISCPTVTFNKKNIDDFRFGNEFSVNMDWKGWLDLSQKNGSFVWLRKILVSHRVHEASETTNGLAENRRQQEDGKIFQQLWPKPLASLLSKLYSISYKNNN